MTIGTRSRGRRIAAIMGGVLASLVLASSAFAFDCSNVSKSDPMDGAQLRFNMLTGEIEWMTPGLAQRFARGVIGPDGEGFHGIVAFDLDGDGVADASTWLGVGPAGEIPLQAQLNGPACRGLTNLGLYFTQCIGG